MLFRVAGAELKCRSGSKISGCGDRPQARGCPFAAADAIMVDLHREPASEKQGVGFFCDGRASLVGWVERQRYPSNSVRHVDGFREGLNPSYGLPKATGPGS